MFEGYLVLMKLFANLPNTVNIGSVENHPKVISIDDDDQIMIKHKETALHS
jgi:hypothetical protein